MPMDLTPRSIRSPRSSSSRLQRTAASSSKYDASSPLIGSRRKSSRSSSSNGTGTDDKNGSGSSHSSSSSSSSSVPPPILIGGEVKTLRFTHHEPTGSDSSSINHGSSAAAASPPASPIAAPIGAITHSASLPSSKTRTSSSSSRSQQQPAAPLTNTYYQHASSSLPASPHTSSSTGGGNGTSTTGHDRRHRDDDAIRVVIDPMRALRRKSMSASVSSSGDSSGARGVNAQQSHTNGTNKDLSVSSSHDSDDDLEKGEDATSHLTDPNPHHHGQKSVKGGAVTIGGKNGYISRRVFHVVGFSFLPFFYYILLPGIYDGIGVTDIDRVDRIVMVVAIIAYFVAEPIRMKYGLVGFGQREWERHQPSTQFWSTITFLFVVAFSPPDAINEVNAIPGLHWANLVNRGLFGAPIVWSLVVDALLGEMRRTKWSTPMQLGAGTAAVFAIWFVSAFVLGTPWWFALLMPPITVAAEYPDLRIIDDNAMMLMIPFFAVFMIDAFGGREAGAALYDAVHSTPRY